MNSGILIKQHLLSWQIALLEGKAEPVDDEQLKWFEGHDMDVLIDERKIEGGAFRSKEFCPPTFAAMSVKDD